MTRRLQVLLDEEELQEIQAVASAHRMTTAEWVRQALRSARGAALSSVDRKRAALEKALALHLTPPHPHRDAASAFLAEAVNGVGGVPG